jgi:predicted RNase H-like HicB family nuclease
MRSGSRSFSLGKSILSNPDFRKRNTFLYSLRFRSEVKQQMDFTAIIRKGEEQYIALCAEVDVVSQGRTIEDALANLKEAVELYVEEMGLPDRASHEAIIARFAVQYETS